MVVGRSEFKGLLAGMLLGDGCLSLGGGRNAYMSIWQKAAHEEYLRHKAGLLEEFTAVTVYPASGKTTKGTYPGVVCKTRRHPLYTRLHQIAYPGGKKTVTTTWLSWLSAQGLALWYMDDGSLNKRWSHNKSGRYRIASRTIALNSCGYSLDENRLLRDFIQDRFGVQMKVRPNGPYYRLMCGAREGNRFLAIIRPYLVPCMAYKFDMQYQQPNEGRFAAAK